MGVTLDWLGCATFRLQIDEFVIFLDGYIDRVPSAPPVGLVRRRWIGRTRSLWATRTSTTSRASR